MAKLPDYNNGACSKCCAYYTVTYDRLPARAMWLDGAPIYIPASEGFTKSCACPYPDSISYTNSTNAKETKVTKQFDTTANKSAALNAVLNRVEDIERALLNRSVARAKLEIEHTALIAEASVKLDRAVAEALHSDVGSEEYELYLPEYQDELTQRAIAVSEVMSLADVLESV